MRSSQGRHPRHGSHATHDRSAEGRTSSTCSTTLAWTGVVPMGRDTTRTKLLAATSSSRGEG